VCVPGGLGLYKRIAFATNHIGIFHIVSIMKVPAKDMENPQIFNAIVKYLLSSAAPTL
jgi:hypothetical protein